MCSLICTFATVIERILLILLTFCSCFSTATAQQYTYNLDFELSAKDFCDTIPITYERGQVYIMVEAEGLQLRFKLDTGSSTGVVYTDTPLHGLKTLGTIMSHDANGRSSRVNVVQLPPLKLSPHLTLSRYAATVHSRRSGRSDHDGIIGFSLFSKGVAAKINTREGYMVLTDRRKQLRREPGFGVRYKLMRHVPRIEVSPFQKTTVSATFDTGSPRLLALNAADYAGCLKRQPDIDEQEEGRCRGQMAIGNYGVEPEAEVVFLGLERLMWGEYRFCDVHCITTQGDSHIGAALLQWGTLTILPRDRRLVFSPYDEESRETMVSNRQLDVAFVPRNDKPAVGLVLPNGEAWQQGFRPGDVIEEIDHQPVTNFVEFVRRGFLNGKYYTFTLRDRDGQVRYINAIMPTR